MTQSKKPTKRVREAIMGPGGLSQTRKPSRKGKTSARKQRGKPDMTRREYAGRW